MAPLRRSAVQALQALLQLAQEPQQWLSVNSVAAAQGLPAPMLEQLLLELLRPRPGGGPPRAAGGLPPRPASGGDPRGGGV
jgi:hypothetical protein